MTDTSLLRADTDSSPTSCSTRVYSPRLESYSSNPPVELLHAPLLVGLGLQSLDVPSPRSETTQSKPQLPDLIEERLQDPLGKPLTTVDLASIQMMPSRSCLLWKIVAVEDSDGVLRYGKVLDDEDLSSSGEVKVQVSKTCIRWYAASQLYFFPSVVKTSKEVDVWSDDREETDASTVGVVAEVNALLARLNVSLSTNYEELLAEVWRLQHRIALVEEDRRAALQQIEHALRAQRDAEKALVCVVCLVNVVDRVLVPCGHSYCSTCVKRLVDGSSCPVCRHDISHSAVFRIS